MHDDHLELNRAAFLAGSLAAASVAFPQVARSAAPAASGTAASPQALIGRLVAGNKRFIENDFPTPNRLAEKRALLTESQAPFAAVLSCSDSRVLPNLVFVQGIGDLFAARVAGNYPDDLVFASLDYAIDHLGTRLVVVLGHQNCGAVKAVYGALETKTPLPPELAILEKLIGPGISDVVKARGTQEQAVEANVRAAVASLKAMAPQLSKGVSAGSVLVAGAVYELGSGQVRFLD
jgi:carbonic anhydrase